LFVPFGKKAFKHTATRAQNRAADAEGGKRKAKGKRRTVKAKGKRQK